MKYTLSDLFLEFKTPFAIAHGTRTGTDIVILKVESENIVGYGEASLPPYLPETVTTVHEFIIKFFADYNDLSVGLNSVINSLHKQPGNFAAKAAIDIALHNWFSNMLGIPVWKMLGLEMQNLPQCTFTIGMAAAAEIKEKIKDAASFKILKVKLGGKNDSQIIKWIRELTDKPICIDVNQGWEDKNHALEMISWLKTQNVLFVEQPMPKHHFADMKWLHQHSSLPLYADEDLQVYEDLEKISKCYDGVNVKLMKCGGIAAALNIIRQARNKGMKVLIGSMSETGCGINAAAHLSSLADYTDLDGPLLTINNPFEIVKYEDGKVIPIQVNY
jgi:L-Ala-D/L-Glu epimerase